MGSKCRPGSLGRGDLCRTAIAFDLACRGLACPVPHKTAVKLSGLPSEGLYVAALCTAQRSVPVRSRELLRRVTVTHTLAAVIRAASKEVAGGSDCVCKRDTVVVRCCVDGVEILWSLVCGRQR